MLPPKGQEDVSPPPPPDVDVVKQVENHSPRAVHQTTSFAADEEIPNSKRPSMEKFSSFRSKSFRRPKLLGEIREQQEQEEENINGMRSRGSSRRKFKKTFNLDRRQDVNAHTDTLDRTNKVTMYKLCSCRRPWMRSFHFAWLNFFLAFMGWFAVGPCIPDILESGVASEADVQTSTVMSLVGTIFIRFALGPLCEAYGPRTVMVWNMFLGGIIVLLTAVVSNGTGLITVRFFVGFIGGTFVPCQFWCAMMFSSRVVGVTSGLAAGLGNTGAGVIVFFMAALLSGFTSAGYDADTRWRLAMLIPGIMMILIALPTWFLTDDCPQGTWDKRKYNSHHDRYGQMAWLRGKNQGDSMRYLLAWERYIESFHKYNYPARWCSLIFVRIATDNRMAAFKDWKAWAVGLQYAVCSGVELSILTGLTSYYRFEFGCDGDVNRQLTMKYFGNLTHHPENDCFALSTTDAAYVASIFGFTNFYGRALGGFFSDALNRQMGVRGRHLANFLSLFFMGITMLVWAEMTDWRASAGVLVFFSTTVHVSKGTVFAATPFVNPTGIGPVTGVVSAVGNIGGVVMATMYSQYATSRQVYLAQSFIVIAGSFSAILNPLIDPTTKKSTWALKSCDRYFVKKADDATDVDDIMDLGDSLGGGSMISRRWGQSLSRMPMGWISFMKSGENSKGLKYASTSETYEQQGQGVDDAMVQQASSIAIMRRASTIPPPGAFEAIQEEDENELAET